MEKFYLPPDSVEYFRQARARGAQMENEWRKKFHAYKQAFPEVAAAASPIGWQRYAGDEGTVIGVERFGSSAPGQEVLAHLGITADHVAAAALRLLGKNNEADLEYGSVATLVTA
jgi:transketolase